MNTTDCAPILDRLPELAAGTLPPAEGEGIRGHLASCSACRAEWEIVQLLAEAGPRPVPADLESRIVRNLRSQAPAVAEGRARPARSRPRWRVPSWGLAAAAGIVLAVATPVLVERMGENATSAPDEVEVATALGDRLPSPWLEEEGIIAGAPVLDGLSDEALEQLLEEMGG